jgi:peptide maturation system protein (TIGR04066 family)
VKKKLVVYPFFEEFLPILQHQNKIQDYELTYAVIPKGWEFDSELRKQYAEFFCPEEKFYSEKFIDLIDAVLLCRPVSLNDISIYDRMIALAEKYNKKIIYVPELEIELANPNMKQWICLRPEQVGTTKNSQLFNIDVPVVMILGLGENCEKWGVQLNLHDYFVKKGYKVSLISSNMISQIMGMHTLPDGLDSPNLTFSQQVIGLNAFIKKVELEDKPNLIILGVPGGIMKYSKTVPNGYGYLPFLISNAAAPDISILSLYCGEYSKEHLKEIQSVCFYRFNIRVDYFHISQKVCNYDFETKQINYYSVDNPYLTEKIIRPQETMPAFNILDEQSQKKVFDSILNELQSNVAVV